MLNAFRFSQCSKEKQIQHFDNDYDKRCHQRHKAAANVTSHIVLLVTLMFLNCNFWKMHSAITMLRYRK